MVYLRRVACIGIATLGLAPAIFSASYSHEAEYLGGTVKVLDEKTNGALDLKDPINLKFKYGGLAYQMPYASIRSFQFASLKAKQTKIVHIPVPKMPFRNSHFQVVAISFVEEDGSLGTASFRVSDASKEPLETDLNEKVQAERKFAVENGARNKRPETWWGDKNWKTLRNKASWPDPSSQNTPAAGTK